LSCHRHGGRIIGGAEEKATTHMNGAQFDSGVLEDGCAVECIKTFMHHDLQLIDEGFKIKTWIVCCKWR
jgi:hypothetical protein